MAAPARAGRGVTTERDRVVAVVRGVVQGVGFRWFVQRQASGLGLDGWVRNRPDGSVELLAEGPAGDVAALLAAVEQGPDGAWVSGVDVRHEVPTGAAAGGFQIRSGAHSGD
ncbi:MAG: acylphosphatase [Chloroflexota bacterium]